MRLLRRFLPVLVILPLAAGCSTRAREVGTVTDQESAMESAVTAIGGILDDQTTEAGFSSKVSQASNLAAACARVASQSCVAAAKSIAYAGCTAFDGLVTMTGTVDLAWSGNGDCVLDTSESLTRIYDLTLLGPRGGTLTLSSATATTYDGQTFGGGSRLTRSSSTSWSLEILGKHKHLSYQGTDLYDVSLRTTTPITVSGTLARAGRTVNGGALTVHHNEAEFTVTYQPSNLVYMWSSCHPQGGTLLATYSGSITGTASILFTGNGNATITKNGTVTRATLSYCE